MERRSLNSKLPLLINFIWVLILSVVPAIASERDIKIDADSISFSQETGLATAEGNVSVHNQEMRLFAPYIQYDSTNNRLSAESDIRGSITFLTQSGRLSGEKLQYDLTTKSGYVLSPSGKIDHFFVKGKTLEIKPLKDVPNVRNRKGKKIEDEDIYAEWTYASVSTCGRSAPHYRFEARSLIINEGISAIIRAPRVYLGERLLFSYPFDYYISLSESDKRHKQSIFPRVGYESKKGAGLGLSVGWGWDSGYADISTIGWTKGIWEADIKLTQDIAKDTYLYLDAMRKYDKDRDATLWRPALGLRTQYKGWQADLMWAQRQLVTMEKRSGRDSRFVVWKKPDLNIISPWYDDAATSGQFRLLGSWGRYEDATAGPSDTYDRIGVGAQLKGEFLNSREVFQPFYNAVYWYYDYSGSSTKMSQKILDASVGFMWALGAVDMQTAYVRRWQWGRSPMEWDDMQDKEEIYHSIAFSIPTSDKEISWKVGVRAAYDIEESKISEMVYKVAYDQHCMLWEAVYRDDMNGSDSWFGLNLSIKAFPDHAAHLGTSELFEPKDAPNNAVPLHNR